MSPYVGRPQQVSPRTGFTRCPDCYQRVEMAGLGAEAALYSHTLSGNCSAHLAPKTPKPRTSKKDREAQTASSPTRLNDWAVMFDG